MVAALLVGIFAGLSRINVYEMKFHPVSQPDFVATRDAKLDPDEKVISVRIDGAARAYPIRSMAYHHIVNDVVAGIPIVATYCTLCHTGLVWRSEIDGLRLTFHMAGINNQNFLMRDQETGPYWQQVSGAAISGPMKGKHFTLVPADELTFALWKAEKPDGTVLKDVSRYASEYAPENWEAEMKKRPAVLNYRQPGLEPRDLMLGISVLGASRAFPYDLVIKEKLVIDHVGSEQLLLVVGPDGESVRAFQDRIPGVAETPEFYRSLDEEQANPDKASRMEASATAPLFIDAAGGSEWNFQGCAVSGSSKGVCLEPVDMIKDYWFDWRHYHPDTTVYGHK